MKKTLYFTYWSLALVFISNLKGFAKETPTDSTKSEKEKNYSTAVIVRMHSLGLFSYSGRLISNNPTADVFFNYNYANKWGINAFKAVDLYHADSDYNFMILMANKNFVLSKKLNINVFGGFLLEQEHHFADHGSDVVGNITTTFKLTRYFTLEHMGLFGNLVLERSNADWVNRFKLIFSKNHLDLTAWAWHNNEVFDSSNYTSAGLSAFYSRIPVSSRVALSTGVTGLMMLKTSDEISTPKKHGVLLTIAATWH